MKIANHDENLKKISELEIISDEELDKVSGGGCRQSSDDSRFLNVLMRGHPAQPERFGATKILFDVKAYGDPGFRRSIAAAWATLGVTADLNNTIVDNVYKIDGKKVSQQEAWAHARAFHKIFFSSNLKNLWEK